MQKFVFLLLITCVFASVAKAARPLAHVITIDGIINPASAEYIVTAIEEAEEAKANCLIIKLDTPGGLIASTRIITKAMLASEVPIAVYVAPDNARAGSAGVFITLAAHVAAMAPSTNIGAAHPVFGQGQSDSAGVLMDKITNDTAAYVRTLAERHGRNAEWAEDAVRNSVSITATEALEKNVIDFICKDLDSLLTVMDSLEVETTLGKVVMHTKDAEINDIQMNWRQKLLDIITDPNIAYILMMLGFYGLYFELSNPGGIFPGVVGVICLILAFYGLQTLPVNYAGLALIVFGLALLLFELKFMTHGLLSIGGIISLIIGSVMLIDSTEKALQISWKVILPTVGFTAVFFLFVIGMGVRALNKKPVSGLMAMIGETGEVKIPLKPVGQIFIHGALWRAECEGGEAEIGEKVRIKDAVGLLLKVERIAKT